MHTDACVPRGRLRPRNVINPDLTKLSDAELVDLNRRIVGLLRDRQQAKTYRELAKFGVGDHVWFEASDGRRIDGEVVRVSKKTVTVCSGDRHHWRVSPSLLTKVSGPSAPWEPLTAVIDEYDESEEPSQAQFDRCRVTINAWWDKFEKTLLYKRLSAEHQREGRHIATAFSDFMYNYHGYVPAKWTDSALHEVVTDIMPRKIVAEERFFAAIAPVLTQFFSFLADKGYQRNAAVLVSRIQNLGDEIIEAARKRSNWRSGKQLMLAAQARQDPIRNEAKVGRNEPCPCGSGKKFKKCCAGKLRAIDIAH